MKKKVITLVAILILAFLLLPTRSQAKDGGTVEYRAFLYAVKDVHSFKETDQNYEQEYYEGLIIELFGLEIFNNVK